MALREILRYPDPRLHKVAQPVDQVDARIQQLIDDMAQTMYDAPGIGLAATQIDVHERVITIDVSEDKSELLVLINPQIVASSDDTKVHEEGCLSVPGIYENVERADRISVNALNRDGQPFSLDADGLLSVCIQHEIDHLDGKVFVEHLSRLKRGRIKTKMLKLDREQA